MDQNSQAESERNTSLRQPLSSGEERAGGESGGLGLGDNSKFRKLFAPVISIGSGATVSVLVHQTSLVVALSIPKLVPLGPNEVRQLALHHHRQSLLLPGPPQERGDLESDRRQIVVRHDPAVLEDQPVAAATDFLAVRRHRVELVRQRPSRDDLAVLDHRRPLPEDEVDRPVDAAVAVELTLVLVVQRVLGSLEAAVEQCRLVSDRPERHRLMPLRPRFIAEGYCSSHEIFCFVC